jgi:hypothetical protein
MKPFDGQPATVGNGVMVAFEAKDPRRSTGSMPWPWPMAAPAKVRPGRAGGRFYAAYFRDPDGNKLNAFVMGLIPAAGTGRGLAIAVQRVRQRDN